MKQIVKILRQTDKNKYLVDNYLGTKGTLREEKNLIIGSTVLLENNRYVDTIKLEGEIETVSV